MKDKFFLDTNIFIYSIEGADEKGITADHLIERALNTGDGIISYQVVQECLNVITRKAQITATEELATRYVQAVLMPLCELHSSPGIYLKAIEVKYRWQFSFYDALIVASAL